MRFTQSNRIQTAAGPIAFGGLFLAPLIAQSMAALDLAAPFGLARLTLGLIIGLSLGVVAAFRGSWV